MFIFEVSVLDREKLIEIYKDDFDSFFKVMEKSFPEIERRTYEGQKELFDESQYRVLGYKNNNNEVTAFIAFWEFDDFHFIEHFAVDEELRGNGIGSRFIKDFLNKSAKKTVLEVEYPEDEISMRRIEFYKRIGMNINDYEYVQPPLQKGQELLPLKIMSYPDTLDKAQFDYIRKELYDNVYKFKG